MNGKILSIVVLVVSTALSAPLVLADRGGRDGYRGDRGHYAERHYYHHDRGHHRGRHWRSHHGHHGHYRPAPRHHRGHYNNYSHHAASPVPILAGGVIGGVV